MTKAEEKQLKIAACKVRMGVLSGTHGAKAGHPGGSLSAADMFTYLYFKELNVDPTDPKKSNRDRFMLSKGHTAPGLYSALAHRGFFPVDDLPTLRHINSYLQGHPKATRECGRIVTCEEHSVIGDLGEAVCAVIARHGIACPVERIGINDEFGHSGAAGELLKQFGLCADHIVEVAQKICPAL